MINNTESIQERFDLLHLDLIEKGKEEYPSLSDEIVTQVINLALNRLKETLESDPKLKQDMMTIEINRWDDQIVDPLYETISKAIKRVSLLAQKQLDEIKQRLSLLNEPVEEDVSDSDSDGSWDLESVSIKKGKK